MRGHQPVELFEGGLRAGAGGVQGEDERRLAAVPLTASPPGQVGAAVPVSPGVWE